MDGEVECYVIQYKHKSDSSFLSVEIILKEERVISFSQHNFLALIIRFFSVQEWRLEILGMRMVKPDSTALDLA